MTRSHLLGRFRVIDKGRVRWIQVSPAPASPTTPGPRSFRLFKDKTPLMPRLEQATRATLLVQFNKIFAFLSA